MSQPPGMPDADRHDGCAGARAAARARCDEAERARGALEAAVERTRDARRHLAAARRSADEAAGAADPVRRRETKAQAREAYLRARALARDDEARTAAVADWAREVDRINRAASRARRALHSARAEAARTEALVGEAERAEQAARLAADAVRAECLEARVRLAECEERAEEALRIGQAAGPPPAGVAVGASTPAVSAPAVSAPAVSPSGAPLPGAPPASPSPPGPARPQGGVQPGPAVVRTGMSAGPGPTTPAGQPPGAVGVLTIEALLDGDRGVLERVAARLSEHTGRATAEEQLRMRELVEAIRSTAAQHGYLSFDARHPLWAHLSEEEARDVVAALARMGFELDPSHGWRGGRSPAARDLSMALTYAGVEVRTLRQHPDAEQIRLLPASIAVDARGLLAAEAPDLALDAVVRMLEGRADGLGSLWDDWGQVRLVLLAPLGSLAGGEPDGGATFSRRP